jgi:hypothetical protein
MPLMTSQDWLSGFLRAHGGVAGTVHRVPDLMELDAAVNIPPPVVEATRAKAVGAGAGVAIPVHDAAGKVRAVVGIAFAQPRGFADEELRALQRAAEALS